MFDPVFLACTIIQACKQSINKIQMFLLRATSICKLLCPYSRLAQQQQQLWVTATSNSQPYSSTGSSDLNVNEQFVPGLDHIIPPHHLKRKGFGGKIVLPASVLHSAVVSSETPVELTLRAYHVGKQEANKKHFFSAASALCSLAMVYMRPTLHPPPPQHTHTHPSYVQHQ